jgi:hypothetical protein
MSGLPETCPHCAANLQGDPIAEEYRECYAPTSTHYSRIIGIEVRGVYDGVLYWSCPDCGGTWHRWDAERYERRHSAAVEHMALGVTSGGLR